MSFDSRGIEQELVGLLEMGQELVRDLRVAVDCLRPATRLLDLATRLRWGMSEEQWEMFMLERNNDV